MKLGRLTFLLPALALLVGCPSDDTSSNDTLSDDTTGGSGDGTAPTTTPTTTPITTMADTTMGDTGMNDTGDTGMNDTGMNDTGMTDTGMNDTGMTDTGATDTGATDTGATDTGATDTGATDTGATDTGSESGSGTGAGTLVCADLNIGSALPHVENGTNTGFGDDFQADCSTGNDEDILIQWAAPSAGTFIIDTIGSDYDTILYILEDCAGGVLACNDDSGGALTSSITIDLTAGQTILIGIDGYDEAGNFVLNINEQPGIPDDGYGNCSEDITMGCEPGEVCLNGNDGTGTGLAACGYTFCEDETDCPTADTGNATVECSVAFGGPLCVLDCSNDETCPDGMVCFDDVGVCLFEFSPVDGTCCYGSTGQQGCEVAAVEACVCAIDDFCCDTEWDGTCAAIAVDDCDADC